jgi:hypothetical protein
MAVSSFASGALVTTQGWAWLNLGSLLPIALVALALLWMARQPRVVGGGEGGGVGPYRSDAEGAADDQSSPAGGARAARPAHERPWLGRPGRSGPHRRCLGPIATQPASGWPWVRRPWRLT